MMCWYHLVLFYGLWVDFVPSLVVEVIHGFPPTHTHTPLWLFCLFLCKNTEIMKIHVLASSSLQASDLNIKLTAITGQDQYHP